jgi:small-conductance mechanosensitive channel
VTLSQTPLDARAQEASPQSFQNQQAAVQSPTAPVVIDGITLFSVRGVSAYPAEKRANDIVTKIIAVAANRSLSKDSLRLSEVSNATTILAGDRPIMTVVDADAALEGVRRQVLAQALLARIREAIDTYRHDRAPARLTRLALYALAAIAGFLIATIYGRRLLRRIRETIERRYKDKIRGVGIQSFEIVRTEQLWRILNGLWNLFWGTALLTAAYLCLVNVLSLFPWTRGLSNDLLYFLFNPLETMGTQLLRVIPDLVFLVILGLATRYVLILIRLFFAAIESEKVRLREFDPAWGKPTYRLVRVAVIAFALVVAYPYIPGSGSEAFKGISLFVGVLVSLGSTSLIGNVIAGYTMTYRRTFKKGDRVKIGDHVADVEQIRVMATYLRTPKNELIVVPNSKIISEEVINYSTLAQREGLILHTTVGIGYESPWRQVEAMLLEAASRTKGLLREPKPFVLQKALGDFSVTYELNGYCHQPHSMGRVYSELHQNILDLFNEYGVQIMTPSYETDPTQAKVVPKEQWYAAPARPPDSPEPMSSSDSMPKAS